MKTITTTLMLLLICVAAHSQSKIVVKSATDSKTTVTNENKTKPLFIVDGVKLSKEDTSGNIDEDLTLDGIDPNDIQQIEVLKDKQATDKYGEEGKNGVIIITTKDPKKYRKR
jgi:TonB-dependent SusC/RagA subfamily outer membrane receptor